MFFDDVLGNTMIEAATMFAEGMEGVRSNKNIVYVKRKTTQEREQLTDEEKIEYDLHQFNARQLRF